MTESTEAAKSPRPLPVVIQPKSTHKYTFVFLHGLGSNGTKFGHGLLQTGVSSEGKTLATAFPEAKFIFPTAKWRRSTAFGRARLTQWFDIHSLKDPDERQELQLEGFAESATYIRSIISQEMKILPPENIILGGLSQGCAMGLLIILSLEFSLCAYIGMSGWLPSRSDIDVVLNDNDDDDGVQGDFFSRGEEHDQVAQDPSIQALNLVRDLLSLDEVNRNSDIEKICLSTPIFLGHGAKDEKVKLHLGREAASSLTSLGMDVTWREYSELGHWYQLPEEIDDILEFLSGKVK